MKLKKRIKKFYKKVRPYVDSSYKKNKQQQESLKAIVHELQNRKAKFETQLQQKNLDPDQQKQIEAELEVIRNQLKKGKKLFKKARKKLK